MAAIRYIFLSDLHFGERNSILTDPLGPGMQAPVEPSEGMEALVACLQDVVRSCSGGAPPRLVLLGDAFELALAPRHVAFDIFARFVGMLFPDGGRPLFDPRIVFVPGNHDHDLWTSTRDDLLNLQLARSEGRLEPTAPVTTAFDLLCPRGDGASVEPTRSEMLTRLLHHRLPQRSDLEVQVAYPNLGVFEGDRAVVAHHGHFMDDVYVLMSTVSRAVFGGERVTGLDQLEADNGAWIDFVWSSLGREGSLASGLRRSYDLLQSGSGKVLLASRLAAAFASVAPGNFAKRVAQRLLLAPLLRALDGLEKTDIRRSLPATEELPGEVLGYIDGPLAAALRQEYRERGIRPQHHTFLYGHTHRPLAQWAWLPREQVRVAVYNTGGWVVDTQMPRPATSGGMVLVDETLETVLVRIGAQVLEPHIAPVRVEQCDGAGGAFARQVEALVHRPGGPWRHAAGELGSAILRRRSEHAARLIREMEQLNGYERLALRSDTIWKLLARRRAEAEREFRKLISGGTGEVSRKPRLLRQRSPIALPPHDAQSVPTGG
ncbi:hypothetical protein [Vulgatibacter sp.]|uniref:hypothetical protein n=1 Tax=Vulgatibacter sp. TaxID=1971226 RepID=UPI0035668AB5